MWVAGVRPLRLDHGVEFWQKSIGKIPGHHEIYPESLR